MDRYYHIVLLSLWTVPALAVDNENLKKDKELLTISQDEERMTSSEDEERGFGSKKVESSSESLEGSQKEETSESEGEGEELNAIHNFASTSWTGEHLPLNLRAPAQEFYNTWHPLSAQLQGNPYANFINQVIETDGIGINSTTLDGAVILDYGLVAGESLENSLKNWEIFITKASRLFEATKMLDNPFADYFQGVFAYFVFKREESNLSKHQRNKKAATLLNRASTKHYLRATRFMLKNDLGHILALDPEELQTREKMYVDPLQVIIDYVNSTNYPRRTKIQSIDTLESILDLLPGDTEVYRATYKHWVEELTGILESSKSTPSGWVKNLSTLTITAFAANVLLASAGNSFSSWSIEHMVAPAILGMTQAASGITSVVVGGITTPWLQNLWSSLRFQDREGNFQWRPTKVFLLKDDLTLAQITDAARLVILYSLLYNAEKVKNRIDLKSDQSKAYIRKLHNLILSCDYQLTETLSNVILMKEQQEFKY